MRATNAMNRFHPFLHLPLLFIFIQPFGGSILTGNHQLSQKWGEKADSEPMESEMKFMRGLFDQFNKGDRGMGRHRSSTATGYAPAVKEGKNCPENEGPKERKKEKAKEEGKFGMAFRLNELKPAERLVRAELHLFFPNSIRHGNSSEFLSKKYGKLNGKGYSNKYPPKYIELFHRRNCAKDGRKILGRVEKEKDGREEGNSQMGWATFDAFKLVEEILARREESSELFIQVKKHGQFLSSAQLHRLAHLHRPFLVIYTDLEDEGKKPIEEGKRAKREAQKSTNYGNADAIRRHMEEARKTAEYYSYGMAKGGNNNQPKEEGGGGIQMPIDGMGKAGKKPRKNWRAKGTMNVPKRRRKQNFQHDPMLGFGTSNSPWERRKNRKSFRNDPLLGFGTPNSPWDRNRDQKLLQSPNSGNSLNDIRALHENGYKMEEERKEAKHGGETNVILMEEEKKGREKMEEAKKCGRHNLTVDFRELDWADRIIAPKRFEAGFCGGGCDYPLDKDLHASNHAILQSLIVHRRKLDNHHRRHQIYDNLGFLTPPSFADDPPMAPPPVCCAPAKFDSLTILYFDENDNVVLKNYPRMIVLECGCI